MSALEAEGIWGHIVARVKPVEVTEIARVIGVHILTENSRLWEELKAFNSILSDLATADLLSSTDDSRGALLHNDGNRRGSRNSETGGCGILNAASLSKVPTLDLTGGALAGNNSGRGSNNSTSRLGSQLTGRSARSMDSLEFVQSIEGSVNVSTIHEVVDSIRKALIGERAELESEISVLQQAMDGETDIISSRSASARSLSSSGSVREKEKDKEKKSKISRFQNKTEDGGQGGRYCGKSDNIAEYNLSRQNESKDGEDIGDCAECRRLHRELEPGKIRPGKMSTSTSLSSVSMSRQEYVSFLSNRYGDNANNNSHDKESRILPVVMCTKCVRAQSQSQSEKEKIESSAAAVKKITNGLANAGIAMPGCKSRTRNKIQAARDEKHFLDFDI